jgi:hypothetical protein
VRVQACKALAMPDPPPTGLVSSVEPHHELLPILPASPWMPAVSSTARSCWPRKWCDAARRPSTPDLYARCLLLADQMGDPAVHAWVLVHNGDALRELGEAGRARHAYEEALEIDESLGDVPGKAGC